MSKKEDLKAVMLIKTLNIIYGYRFYKLGELKFSNAKSWVEFETKYGHGKGDFFEGVYAQTKKFHVHSNKLFSIMYADSEITEYKRFINLFRRKSTMELPATCFYSVDYIDSNKPSYDHIIKEQYYTDFGNNDNGFHADFSRSCSIEIKNIDEFKHRLYKTLHKLGLDESEIIFDKVHYDKRLRSTEYFLYKESPYELFIKDDTFIHQSEYRLVINTKNLKILDYLRKNPIKIGSIEDIANFNTYLPNGDVKITLNRINDFV